MPTDEMIAGLLRAAAITWPKHHAFRLEKQGEGPLLLIAYAPHPSKPELGVVSQVLVSIDHPTPYNLLGSLLWNS